MSRTQNQNIKIEEEEHEGINWTGIMKAGGINTQMYLCWHRYIPMSSATRMTKDDKQCWKHAGCEIVQPISSFSQCSRRILMIKGGMGFFEGKHSRLGSCHRV